MDRKTRRQYDGVVYTPSRRVSSASRNRQVQSRKKVKQTNLSLFYALTLFTGVVVCVVVFATMFTSLLSGEAVTPAPSSATQANERPTPTTVAFEQTISATGVIKNIGGGSDKILVIYDINENKNYNLLLDGATELKNKYGQAIAYAELNIGDIADIVFEQRGSALKSLMLSGQAWERRQATKVNVDYIERTVAIDNDVFSYTDELICHSRGANIKIDDIRPIDIVNMKGYKDRLWYIELVRSYGYLDFTGKELVVNGTFEIDNDFARDLKDANKTEILEGMHRVIIKGDNIELFIRDITIERNETYVIDINDVDFKKGIININANVSDYTLTVNGDAVSTSEPLMLEYGDYRLKINKEGYLPWEENVKVGEPTKNISAELQEELLICKLTINTYPAGAEIYIDNSYVGVSPITTPVVYGRHKIITNKPGYKTVEYEWILDEPSAIYDIFLQEEEPVMPPGYGF